MAGTTRWGVGETLLFSAAVSVAAACFGVAIGAAYLQLGPSAEAHGAAQSGHGVEQVEMREVVGESGSYAAAVEHYAPPDVPLVGHDGQPATARQVLSEGGPVIVDFIFTTCSTICPILSASFAAAQHRDELTERGARLVSISIDPTFDTPRVLSQMASDYGAAPSWRLYTGQPEDILRLLQAFDAYRGDKFTHQPLTFVRARPGDEWLRLDGFLDGDALVGEFQRYAAR